MQTENIKHKTIQKLISTSQANKHAQISFARTIVETQSQQTSHKSMYSYGVCITTAGILTWLLTTPYMAVATMAYLSMCVGLIKRKTKNTHANFMKLGIFMDFILVLILEVQRNALGSAFNLTLNSTQQAHIGASTIAMLFYFPVLYLGYKRLNGTLTSSTSRNWHIRLGMTAFIFRTIGFCLMFSMLSYVTRTP